MPLSELFPPLDYEPRRGCEERDIITTCQPPCLHISKRSNISEFSQNSIRVNFSRLLLDMLPGVVRDPLLNGQQYSQNEFQHHQRTGNPDTGKTDISSNEPRMDTLAMEHHLDGKMDNHNVLMKERMILKITLHVLLPIVM
ncbi:hypothetical protein PMAYCL1PPCAC_08903 [Pristionchus mayeri]|uniref:Uncharacterized protein n=1 Tax=Pristionchus mayeri TaxID=1317129 RepID=A0AAN4ZCM6_9BILA|nr:hypothetical protein PMAYCL1PPCAC_08903 [Pristionchus mayeri]